MDRAYFQSDEYVAYLREHCFPGAREDNGRVPGSEFGERVLERLHRRQPRRDAAGVEDLRATVPRHPERRLPVLARAAATGEREREQQEGAGSHFSAFERTAPSAVARTSSPL